MTGAAILEVTGLSRWFGGLAAVQDFDVCVTTQEVLAIIGPNGAGKTTIFNLLSGMLRPSAGDVRLDGRSILRLTPERIVRLGLVRTFQNLRLFRRLTVLENVLVASFSSTHGSLWSWALPGHRQRLAVQEARALEALAFTDLVVERDTVAMHLSHGAQRRLEVARALATRPRLLLLDEPCAGLTRAESAGLAALIRRIREDGIAVVLIEHDMDFVMAVADRIVVLNFGRKIAEGLPAEIRDNDEVIAAYLGTKAIHAGT